MKIIFYFLLFSLATSALGQNCCTGGSPLANNLNLSNLDSGLSVQIVFDQNNMSDFVSNNEILDDDSYVRYNSSLFFQLSWAIKKDFSLGLMLNHSKHFLNRKSINVGRETESKGIGDLVFITNYNFWQKGKHSAQLGAGVVLPTGRNDVKDKDFDIILPWDLQPAYGGWGGLVMVQYQNGRVLVDNLNYFGLLVYQHLFENKKPETSQIFKQGAEYQFYQGLGYNIFLNQLVISPQLGLRFRYTNQDRINHTLVESSGGIWLFNMIGLNVLLSQNLTFMAAYENPIYRNLNGSQLTTSNRFRVGIHMFFGDKEEQKERILNF